LKSGKYYFLWETRAFGNNKVISPVFYVTTLADIERQAIQAASVMRR
jgi:hypothetical protein